MPKQPRTEQEQAAREAEGEALICRCGDHTENASGVCDVCAMTPDAEQLQEMKVIADLCQRVWGE